MRGGHDNHLMCPKALGAGVSLAALRYLNLRRIADGEQLSAAGEPSFGKAPRPRGLAVKEAYANSEDLIEVAVSQIEVLKGCNNELGFAGCNMLRIAASRGFDHLF
jgi:hypothetical protein